MAQVRDAIVAINAEVEINIACSLGILTREQGDELAGLGVHRYNHNLETARSYFPAVVTTHTWEERMDTLDLVRELGMEVCCGGIIGMGETVAQRAEFAAQLAAIAPDEVPLDFLDPRPGTPFAHLPALDAYDALRAVAGFRLALPRTVLRFAGGRELTLGDDGTRQGVLGGINAMIVGNYLTTLGRSPSTTWISSKSSRCRSRRSRKPGDRATRVLRRLRPPGHRGRPRALPRASAAHGSAAVLHRVRAQARCADPPFRLDGDLRPMRPCSQRRVASRRRPRGCATSRLVSLMIPWSPLHSSGAGPGGRAPSWAKRPPPDGVGVALLRRHYDGSP